MKKVIDMGLETIQGGLKKADKGYELGTVQSVTTATKNNDAIKVVTECEQQIKHGIMKSLPIPMLLFCCTY